MFTIRNPKGEEIGPCSAEEIKGWLRDGKYNYFTPARRQDDAKWKMLGSYLEFSGVHAVRKPEIKSVTTGVPATRSMQAKLPSIPVVEIKPPESTKDKKDKSETLPQPVPAQETVAPKSSDIKSGPGVAALPGQEAAAKPPPIPPPIPRQPVPAPAPVAVPQGPAKTPDYLLPKWAKIIWVSVLGVVAFIFFGVALVALAKDDSRGVDALGTACAAVVFMIAIPMALARIFWRISRRSNTAATTGLLMGIGGLCLMFLLFVIESVINRVSSAKARQQVLINRIENQTTSIAEGLLTVIL
ncbi:MAG: DUF4339 domain-containing protein [Opitutaceae bacterium]|jgi:hypothetical protein|nr:DUF4339 domain-containing protein [Opitutaceae bacterium]